MLTCCERVQWMPDRYVLWCVVAGIGGLGYMGYAYYDTKFVQAESLAVRVTEGLGVDRELHASLVADRHAHDLHVKIDLLPEARRQLTTSEYIWTRRR